MSFNPSDLIDVEETHKLLESFSAAVGVSAAIIDLEGTVLVSSPWQRICTDFHRQNETSCARCIQSDTALSADLPEGKSFALYRCLNGLTDAASPIIIEGKHFANAFIGQFFTEKPDLDFFRRQAAELGFDESGYLAALAEVPIVAKETLPSILSFLTSFAEISAGMGLRQLRQLKAESELRGARLKLELQNEELLRAKEQWERTFDSVPDLMAILDTGQRIVRANREMARRLGLTPQECAGMHCYQAVHGSDHPPESCPHWRTLRDRRECIAEVHEERLNGDFWVSTTPLLDEKGEMIGTLHVARDITERKRMEDELRKSRDELETKVQVRTAELQRSNQALQDFASISSHDMQEPLRKVISFGDMLRREYKDLLGQTGNDYLDRMLDAAQRMQSLLVALLKYSRVTTKPEPLIDVDLSRIVREALCDLEIRIKKTGGKVKIAELPTIKADPVQMRQLFQNLIGNALKFHKEGGKPVIEVRSAPDGDCGFQIVVEDNGIGFEERYLDKIFTPFQRLHGSNSKYEGAGMGLAICKKIVERHGGSITAKSAPGKGTSFIIRLPGEA